MNKIFADEGQEGMQAQTTKNLYVAVFSAGLICLLVYLRALSCGFLNIDDPVYIENYSVIRQLDLNMVKSVFSEPYYFGWLPLTYLSFAIDYHFWHLNPFGYHLTNIMFHSCNVALVSLITDTICRQKFPQLKSSGPVWFYPAILILSGLLFGIHPMRVESVAWVSQRKDVLNGFFSLGAILFYLLYAQGKELNAAKTIVARNYLISLVLFLFSLMAKQVSVVLPIMLLVADWYPLGRIRKGNLLTVLVEKLPFLAMALAVSVLTLSLVTNINVMVTYDDFPFYARCLVAGTAIFEYCQYLVYPVGIVPYYVIDDTIRYSFIVKTAIVVGFSMLCVGVLRKWSFLGAVWLCFLLPLLPILAFTQTVEDIYLASRYTYLPSVAPSIAAGIIAGIIYQSLAGERKQRFYRTVTVALLAVLLLAYGVQTFRLISVWDNPGALWTRQIEILPLGRAYSSRGVYYFSVGKYQSALQDLTNAIAIAKQADRGGIFNLFAFRGETSRRLGLYESAVQDYTAAINRSPHPLYFYYRGCALEALGRSDEAQVDFRRAGGHTGPLLWFYSKQEQS